KFSDLAIDVVMTVATKGIPLAYAEASFLNVTVLIVRRDHKVTESSSVSINYDSVTSQSIQTMVLTRRSLQEGANDCINDDLIKTGGTIKGMMSILDEFQAQVKAIGVLEEADDDEEDRIVDDYVSLVKISIIDTKEKKIQVIPGNFL